MFLVNKMKIIYRVLYFISICAFIYFFIPAKIYADFVKYSNNPIISNGTDLSFDNRNAYSSSIVWNDQIGSIWYGASTTLGIRSIGLATFSVDPQNNISLAKYPLNPIIKFNFVDNSDWGVDEPFVIFETQNDSSIYKMWFKRTFGPPNYTFTLYYSTSKDGIAWNNPQALNFPPLPANNYWRTDSAVFPHILYRSDLSKYQMWFGARRQSGGNWVLGYADSTDGINWQNISSILEGDPSWDGVDINAPSVIYKNNIYYMFYNGDKNVFYATSLDGIHWNKNRTQIILSPDPQFSFESNRIMYPFLIEKNNLYYLFYTGVNSLHWQIGLATSDSLPPIVTPSISPSLTQTPTPTGSPTPTLTITPTPTETLTPIPSLTPTPTISNTPTSTQTPTVTPTQTTTATPTFTMTPTSTQSPTPSFLPPTTTITLEPTLSITLSPTKDPSKPFYPIVIVPGFGASWNPEALFSCDLSVTTNWTIAPYVNQYKRLVNTLVRNGNLKLNDQVFIYPYDWRQPLPNQAMLFNAYLDQIQSTKPKETKFRIISHSFGGLVMRSYLDLFGSERIDSVLTVGSPHAGTLITYPMWEAGELKTNDKLLKIAYNNVIHLCQNKYSKKSNKEALQQFAPSVRDMLPIFDYLKKDGVIIPFNTLSIRNNWTLNHPFPSNAYAVNFQTISGDEDKTPRYYEVKHTSPKNVAYGLWKDGEVTSTETVLSGDGTVLHLSSTIPNLHNTILSGNHSQIISSHDAISAILNFLHMNSINPYSANNVPEDTSTNVLTLSCELSEKLEMTNIKTNETLSSENFIVNYNPTVGVYKIHVDPKKPGKIKLNISQMQDNTDVVNDTIEISASKNKSNDFYLIYSPRSSPIFNLIPLQ